MKIISLVVIQFIAVAAANITFLWGIIEFIIYLVKDKAFNWWSVWGFIISVVIALVISIYGLIVKYKTQNTSVNNIQIKKSFKQRIEEKKKMEQ